MATLKELQAQGYKKFFLPSFKDGKVYCFHKDEIRVSLACRDDWEPVIEKTKKTVTLYRYTYKNTSLPDVIRQEEWTSLGPDHFITNHPYLVVLKTEAKEVEYEE